MITFSINIQATEIFASGTLTEQPPTTSTGREWWGETVEKVIQGKIYTETLNIDAYSYRCAKNVSISQHTQKNSITPILTLPELQAGLAGVTEQVAYVADTYVNDIAETSEVAALVEEYCQLQEELEIHEGINLWKIMQKALEGEQRMILRLAHILETFGGKDICAAVLRNPRCLELLRGRIC